MAAVASHFGNLGLIWNRFPLTEIQHDFEAKCGITAKKLNDSGIGLVGGNADLRTASICNYDVNLTACTDKGFANGLFDGPNGVFGPRGTLARPTTGRVTFKPPDPFTRTIRSYDYQWTRINEANVTQRWEVKAVEKNRYKGEQLAIALGIPNNSIVIVDTDNGIIKSRLKVGPPSTSYTLYHCINNITRADSAGKTNENNHLIFSGFNGIICKALISNQDVLVPGNNELKMYYNVTNYFSGRQEWTHILYPQTKSFIVDDAHNDNNITNRSAELNQGFATRDAADIRNRFNSVPNAIISTITKRSGDYFQGWITKYLLKKLTGPLTSKYYVTNQPGRVPKYREVTEPVYLVDMDLSNQIGDIFTATGDFPYLCFCIECLGVSVLFKDGNEIVYLRRVTTF